VLVDARTAPHSRTMTTAPTLLVTHDEELLDDVLRLAAAAGATLEVAHDTGAALRGWSSAAAVLIGADLAPRLAAHAPPRRDHVHVVGRGPLPDDIFRAALGAGALDVVELPAGETWLVELLTDLTDGAARRALTVGVVAGSGGAGATTFACALAVTAASGAPALLLDLDPLGPGVDRVLGCDQPDGVRWEVLIASSGRLGSRSLRAALPHYGGLAVLTWSDGSTVDLEVDSVREVLSAARRGNDIVVADLPRRADPVTAEVVSRLDRVLLLTGAGVPAVAAAGKVAARLRELNRSIGLVVRTGSATLAPDQVAEALGLPLVADMASQRRLSEQVELGLGPVRSRRSPLARAAGTVLAALAPVVA
jgi:secretion/DNA translocation related CpaE-like protein